ncbi:hypothetical protein [Streptomyces sp. NPDC007074]|uniref:hypothetical protein n=1 Tax=Streptomyces sp. NPDC007074 TaxID=3156764 RepID=UPI0033F5063A
MTLHFQTVTEPVDDNPDYDDTGCQCPPGDNRYLLEIDEGQPSLVHTACGKQPSHTWGDWQVAFSMEPIPVTVTWERQCDGSEWHGDQRCDDDSWVQATASDRCVHSQAVHNDHHRGSPVPGCPWCTTTSPAEPTAERTTP